MPLYPGWLNTEPQCGYGSRGVAVLKNLRTLVDKELVLTDISEEGVSYSIYNVFLSRYLELL